MLVGGWSSRTGKGRHREERPGGLGIPSRLPRSPASPRIRRQSARARIRACPSLAAALSTQAHARRHGRPPPPRPAARRARCSKCMLQPAPHRFTAPWDRTFSILCNPLLTRGNTNGTLGAHARAPNQTTDISGASRPRHIWRRCVFTATVIKIELNENGFEFLGCRLHRAGDQKLGISHAAILMITPLMCGRSHHRAGLIPNSIAVLVTVIFVEEENRRRQ